MALSNIWIASAYLYKSIRDYPITYYIYYLYENKPLNIMDSIVLHYHISQWLLRFFLDDQATFLNNNKIYDLLELNNLNLMDPIVWPYQTSE